LYPDGLIDIIFNFADDYSYIYKSEKKILRAESYISGVLTEPLELQFNGQINILGIRFNPLGLKLLFPDYEEDTIDKITRFDLIPYESYHPGMSFNEMVRVSEKILMKRMPNIDIRVYEALKIIEKENGMISVQDLAFEAGFSVSSLERHFKKSLGITPKLYCRIVRFRNISMDLSANPEMGFGEIIAKYDYTDNAHFHKDFKNFTKESPNILKDQINIISSKLFAANRIEA
jgi:AraC-like DNA-binding protein